MVSSRHGKHAFPRPDALSQLGDKGRGCRLDPPPPTTTPRTACWETGPELARANTTAAGVAWKAQASRSLKSNQEPCEE